VIPNLYIQLIGLAGVSLSLVVFQTNNREAMLKLGMAAAVFYAVHFYLLGATTGAAMNLIGGARCFFFYRFSPSAQHRGILFTFILLAMIGTAVTWQGPLSLLAFGASIASAIAYWHKKPRSIRKWALLSGPMYFMYDALSGSYPGMLIEVIMLISNIIGEYRFDFRNNHHRTRLARQA
jgi:hypothetical protein